MNYKVKDGFTDLSHFLNKKSQDLTFEGGLVQNLNRSITLEWIKCKDNCAKPKRFFPEWRNEVGFKGTFGGFIQCTCKFRTGRMKVQL